MQNVVLVRRDDEAVDRETHEFRRVAGENIAEISGGDRESNLSFGRAQRQCRGEIVNDLRHNPGPIDGVHSAQAHFAAEIRIVEHVLDERLAVVEMTVNGNRMHIGVVRRRHLPPLYLRNAPVRIQDERVDEFASPERFDRRGTGVSACCSYDRNSLAAPPQHSLEHSPYELHREVLEGERRPVKQFQQEQIGPDLDERAFRFVPEPLVGIMSHGTELIFGKRLAREQLHDAIGDFGIRFARQSDKILARDCRPNLGNIQAAVFGQSREHRLLESQAGSFAPRRNVAHLRQVSCSAWKPANGYYAKSRILSSPAKPRQAKTMWQRIGNDCSECPSCRPAKTRPLPERMGRAARQQAPAPCPTRPPSPERRERTRLSRRAPE